MKGLIGHSGFVGSTLLKQTKFDFLYRSTDISEIEGKSFDLLICAGAPAQKWIANSNPIEDEKNIDQLISHLDKVDAKRIVLISTVDVFKNPVGVNENTTVDEIGLHPYGLNRRKLEKYIESHFKNYSIIRLPGLVGPGLRKNIIFDFKNNNNIQKIESRSVFQFYPMVNLWADIQKSIQMNLKLIHLTSEPVSVKEIANEAFEFEFNNEISNPVKYDFQTIYSKEFGGIENYQYSKRETLIATRSYAQT